MWNCMCNGSIFVVLQMHILRFYFFISHCNESDMETNSALVVCFKLHLLISQLVPLNPGTHWHVNWLAPSIHSPPFWQSGSKLSQSSISEKKNNKKKHWSHNEPILWLSIGAIIKIWDDVYVNLLSKSDASGPFLKLR